MRREELEHLIRASAELTQDEEIVVVGSQAVLGSVPDAPASMLASMEADVFPRRHPERADVIDGAIQAPPRPGVLDSLQDPARPGETL